MKHKVYFAYGSNLNKEQMAKRCPAARPYSRGQLEGYQLEWRGVLTVVRSSNALVEGGLWITTAECEAALDRREGYPYLYRKEYVWVRLPGLPSQVLAYVYIMNRGQEAFPSAGYLEACLQGARDWGIPETALTDTLPVDRHLGLMMMAGGGKKVAR